MSKDLRFFGVETSRFKHLRNLLTAPLEILSEPISCHAHSELLIRSGQTRVRFFAREAEAVLSSPELSEIYFIDFEVLEADSNTSADDTVISLYCQCRFNTIEKGPSETIGIYDHTVWNLNLTYLDAPDAVVVLSAISIKVGDVTTSLQFETYNDAIDVTSGEADWSNYTLMGTLSSRAIDPDSLA